MKQRGGRGRKQFSRGPATTVTGTNRYEWGTSPMVDNLKVMGEGRGAGVGSVSA